VIEACAQNQLVKSEAKQPPNEFWLKNIGPVGEDPSNDRIWQVVPRSPQDLAGNPAGNSDSHVSP